MPLSTLIALCMLPLAYVLERRGVLPSALKSGVASGLIRVIYPSLILASLPTRIHQNELLTLWPLPLATGGLLLAGLWIGRRLLPYMHLEDPGKQRSFVFLAILPNYSYVPLLVAQAFWGERGIALVILSSVGADLFLWTLGVQELRRDRGFQWRQLLGPPFLSVLLSLFLLSFAGQGLREFLAPGFPLLLAIGSLTFPLSMLLLGSHLGRRPQADARSDRKAQHTLLLWRLLLAPALMYGLLVCELIVLPHPARSILLLVASMPAAIVSVVLSEHYQASPEFAARQIFLGHVLWLVTGSFWLSLSWWTLT